MADVTLTQLEMLFQKVWQKHHEAFRETDGADPEWPLWYADWLVDKLSALLGTNLTKSEIVYLLVHLDKEYGREAPDMPWWRYYARFFARRYLHEEPR